MGEWTVRVEYSNMGDSPVGDGDGVMREWRVRGE